MVNCVIALLMLLDMYLTFVTTRIIVLLATALPLVLPVLICMLLSLCHPVLVPSTQMHNVLYLVL